MERAPSLNDHFWLKEGCHALQKTSKIHSGKKIRRWAGAPPYEMIAAIFPATLVFLPFFYLSCYQLLYQKLSSSVPTLTSQDIDRQRITRLRQSDTGHSMYMPFAGSVVDPWWVAKTWNMQPPTWEMLPALPFALPRYTVWIESRITAVGFVCTMSDSITCTKNTIRLGQESVNISKLLSSATQHLPMLRNSISKHLSSYWSEKHKICWGSHLKLSCCHDEQILSIIDL